jgi:hypothetical protein
MKLQPTTNPLILKDSENEFFTSTRIIAEELKINKDFMSDMHKTLHNYFFIDGGIDYINTYCLKDGQSVLHPSAKILNSVKMPNIFREIKKIPKAEKIENKVYWTYELGYGEKFYLSFYNDRGRMLPFYLMNERAYITFIMQLGRYEKAIKIQQKITQAFFLMRDIIKNAPKDTSEFKEVDVLMNDIFKGFKNV